MSKNRKVIITCAVTGAIHTPSMSPYLPVTAEEIIDAAIGAAEAGAALVHVHARDPKTGKPDQSPEAFEPFLRVIKQRSNCVINITTGGSPQMSVEERLRPCAVFKPEVASLNMGSMNFGLYPMLARFKDFKHDWERPYLEGSKERIFKNTFQDIENILAACAENNTRFEIECYDIGHLYTLSHFADRGLIKPPFLFGSDYQWSVLGAGRNQLPIATMAVSMGGNLRVGLEDSLWIGAGQFAKTNADQVRKARQIVEGMGLEIATPDEARAMLQLKGGDKVNF